VYFSRGINFGIKINTRILSDIGSFLRISKRHLKAGEEKQ